MNDTEFGLKEGERTQNWCVQLLSVCGYFLLENENWNVLSFAGQYSGFDVSQPTSQSGGKPRVVHMIKEQHDLWVSGQVYTSTCKEIQKALSL